MLEASSSSSSSSAAASKQQQQEQQQQRRKQKPPTHTSNVNFHSNNGTLSLSTVLDEAAVAADEILSTCYSPGTVSNLGSLLDSSLVHTLRDAKRLCFWMGVSCHGLRCQPLGSPDNSYLSVQNAKINKDKKNKKNKNDDNSNNNTRASSSSSSSSSSPSSSGSVDGRSLATRDDNDDDAAASVTMTSLRSASKSAAAAAASTTNEGTAARTNTAAKGKTETLSCTFHQRHGMSVAAESDSTEEVWFKDPMRKCPYDLDIHLRRPRR